MQSFQYGTTTFNYSVEYIQDKKDVSISVCLKELIAPAGIDSLKLQSILYKKSPWIIKMKYELEEVLEPASPKEFLSGEKFAYLGRHYRLKVNINENIHTPTLTFKQGRFIAEIPNNITDEERTSNLKQPFKEWYITHGYKKIEERLKIYCPKMELQLSNVVFKEQKARWGSCHQKEPFI